MALSIPDVRHSYRRRDTALYALGLGYGDDPMDEGQLSFLDETRIQAVPTMANVLGYPGFWMRDLDTGIDHLKVVHGEQVLELHNALPPEGTVIGRAKIVDLVDKGEGRGALVYFQREITDVDTGLRLATMVQTTFCRGDGGFGGKSETDRKLPPGPKRKPDLVVEIPTPPQLALIYRLSGDYNPLHSDPATARKAGFDRPILHGLATFGLACRGLMSALCSNRGSAVRRLAGRFSAPVYPGETIALDIWNEGQGQAAFKARVPARDAVVLKSGLFDFE
ncbi:MaoC/PaaZ C-terminal domain-containing protein [Roseovarius sp.]|uniref:MaoC/PaaZ C-terminal domain-containing protein n=1 Tax=Roseovarius sp. TaxID=1486281 RepID=UPI00356465DB